MVSDWAMSGCLSQSKGVVQRSDAEYVNNNYMYLTADRCPTQGWSGSGRTCIWEKRHGRTLRTLCLLGVPPKGGAGFGPTYIR